MGEETYVIVLLDRIQRERTRRELSKLLLRSAVVRLVSRTDQQKKKVRLSHIVKPGDEVIIDPLTFPEGHIKDLVVQVE